MRPPPIGCGGIVAFRAANGNALGRAARILRIFRVLRGAKATRVLASTVFERRAESAVLAAALATVLLFVVAGLRAAIEKMARGGAGEGPADASGRREVRFLLQAHGRGGRRMLGAVHEYRMLVLESHLDTFGHVNNAAYLQILEARRLIRPTPEWVRAMGLRPEDLAADDGPGREARP